MAGFLLGAGSGVLAGAAVYYTISTTMAHSTDQIRRDLYTSAALLERSFDEAPGPAPSSFVGPRAGPPPFSELLKQRWNAALGGAYAHARETDWIALGGEAVDGVRGQISKLSAAADETVADAVEGRAVEAIAAVDGAANAAASNFEKAIEPVMGRNGDNVHVDRGLKASERGIKSPKRLV
ncbi:hypothetical protein CcaverHIS002_0506420 [Cutaneotrichosporon cavernicola]|uniref:MICOS complex subunit MIC12 n=1 Tax=Cutaneotrichosporon cavernicola TaxID=279322 RepID=A0AA48L6Q7_9TREE|nr:uncharacterized protein CcaverHIS019_0506940 [Cutaneotrichosporon cavernicola]BEI85241.1 hypothetical protein CcaverHIS002_0506420 [Cutaneotrichosporon cavernicola]BEI93066.1 hypothetical protein CcaverHIS019_0506940 [Cutaneotrichosporon cavernicola]BEJ00843.1 hypothetical protein CcaverHIS631_0507000 [Cutaneotrichosporon cavernicola]BEJ08610.1 hypothetical protein CcaverHIS641_0507040 [Cutaneotrichosporon cavernicola]